MRRRFHLPQSALRIPRGISLIEVLISMFVLLFGLMGVAAIFPVASHYVLEGDKRDRSAGLAQVAFEELKARKVLRPETWVYASNMALNTVPQTLFIDPATNGFTLWGTASNQAGLAFVIDPLATASVGDVSNRDIFPMSAPQVMPTVPPWQMTLNTLNAGLNLGPRWPVRRLSLAVPNPATPITTDFMPVAGETASNTFRLRDDLAVVQPDAGDRPSIQRWQVDNNGTPANPNDDTLLARDYLGDYSWLATVVPANTEALLGLAPINSVKDAWYEVSTAVFYKREVVPSATLGGSAGSERLVGGEFLNSSELAVYSEAADVSAARAEVDMALDGIKPGNWIAVMGVNQVTGAFMMKWYKVLAIEDETRESTNTNPPEPDRIFVAGTNADRAGRYLMVQGPPWPESGPPAARSNWNLGVAILPGIVDVYTRVMQMETN